MIFFDANNIGRFIKYVEIAHHVKGRLRLKFDVAILKEFTSGELESLEGLDKSIKGIKSVRINKLAKSATIEYDADTILPTIWEQLAGGTNQEQIAELFTSLRR